MDLGATLCRPRSPLCGQCPVSAFCQARRTGDPARYPLKTPKADRPRRQGVAWVVIDTQGRVGLVRRPERGLLGGMLGLPTSDWSAAPAETRPPLAADWRAAGSVEHVFTHFALTWTS